MMVWIPTVEYILELFRDQIKTPQLMNRVGLVSTLDKVAWGIPTSEFPTIWERTTILFKEIVENHYFVDGNKRIGILIAFIFLSNNGFNFFPQAGEVFSMTMEVAQGERTFEQIKNWFQKNSHNV